MAHPVRPLLLLLAAAAAGIALLLLSRADGDRIGAEATPDSGGRLAGPAPPPPPPPPLARAAVDAEDATADGAVEAAAPARTFLATGVAVDPDGLPAVGVPLACSADGRSPEVRAPRGTTARDGSFALELPRAVTQVVSADPAWTVVLGGDFRHDGPPLRMVVAPCTSWSGWIVDAAGGAPVPEARIRAVLAAGRALAGLARPPSVETRADADGRFALAEACALPGTRIEVAAEGYLPYVAEPGPGATDLGLIALEAGQPPAARGVARLADGRPAAGAHVRLGDSSTQTDASGAFELLLRSPAPEAPLVATLAQHAPAHVPNVGTRLLAGDVDGLELVFGTTGNAIEGRVVDARGTPLKRWTVEVLEEGGEGGPVGPPQRTRKDGVFRIEGLGPGPYTVVGRGRERDEVAVALSVEAPRAGLELQPAGPPRELAGRVLRADGAPAAGAQVAFLAGGAFRASPQTTRADDEGRFALRDVPDVHGWLCAVPAQSDGGLPTQVGVEPRTTAAIELRLEPAQPVRFEAEDPLTAPDAVFALGPDGRLREAWLDGAVRTVIALDAGRSGVFALPREARVLVLVRFGRELARVAVSPANEGPVAVVRW